MDQQRIEVGEGPVFKLASLDEDARHLRAELSNAEGSRVFVQPFVLAPFGDIDANGYVDEFDTALCRAVLTGHGQGPDPVAAVAAIPKCP